MIYTASYFNQQDHHGRVYCISRTQPKGQQHPVLDFFLPPGWLLDKYRRGAITWDSYVDHYWYKVLIPNWGKISQWASTLTDDVTLCCWEQGATYCHRSLVASFLHQLGYSVAMA